MIKSLHFDDDLVGLRAGRTVQINRFPVIVDAALLSQCRCHVERNGGAHKLQELFEGGNETSSRTTTEVLPKMGAYEAYGQGGLFVINEETFS